MRFLDLTEARQGVLWHGYKEPSNAITAIRNDEMIGTTTQRWWPEGKHYYDDEGEVYDKSYWMKGISFTRDRKYAQQWGAVVFALDYAAMSQRYRIMPFSWNKTIRPTDGWSPHPKREREEFCVLEQEPNTFEDPDTGRLDVKPFMAPSRKSLRPLRQYLRGIWVSDMPFLQNEDLQFLLDHPLFRGRYVRFQRRR